MPRDTQTNRSRVAVQSADTEEVINVSAPSQVAATAGGAAAALSNALKLGTEIYGVDKKRRDKAAVAQAERDFETGSITEEARDKSDAYDRSVAHLEARAGWYEDAPELVNRLKERVDFDNATIAELDAAISDEFEMLYAGMDDVNSAEILVPLMQQFRDVQREALVARQQQVSDDRQVGNFSIDITGRIDTSLAAISDQLEALSLKGDIEGMGSLRSEAIGSAINFGEVHEEMQILFRGDGAAVNRAFTEVIARVAIERGIPELIDSIPQRWPDGTPSVTEIPRYADALSSARAAAERAAASDMLDASAAARENYQNDTLIPLDIRIARGGVSIQELMDDPRLKGTVRRALIQRVIAKQQTDLKAART